MPQVSSARVVASGRRSGRELTVCAPRLRAEQSGTTSYYRCKWCDAELEGSTAACIRNHITGKRVCLFCRACSSCSHHAETLGSRPALPQ